MNPIAKTTWNDILSEKNTVFDPKTVWYHLVSEVKTFFKEAGFERAVLGMSGGIDSAVVYLIMAEALGAENILGVVMPSRFSSNETQRDAVEMLKKGGSEFRVIPIEAGVEIFEKMARFEGVAHENLQARIRMVILMGISNQEGRLLLSTDNKSESIIGYSTLYGDSAGAIAPLGDMYKTQVYSLAHWVDQQIFSFSGQILTREPTAELSEGQKDTDSLPNYEKLDHVLRYLNGEDIPDIKPYSKDLKQVKKMVKAAAFKQQQTCPVIDLP